MLKGLLIGNIGGEPAMKYSANGTPFLQFSVASNDRKRDQSGGYQDVTTWVRCTVFGQRAESLTQYLHRGQRVFVSGRMEANPYTAQDQSINAGLQMIADDVEFMSARRGDDSDDGADVPF